MRQAFSELDDLREGLEDVKNELIAFKNLPTAIGKLDGKVDVLMDICTGIDGKTDKLSSFKSWVIAILGLLIPVAVALIGAYAILKGQAPQAVPR